MAPKTDIHTYRDAVFHVKRGFLIIGLTGFTGSGCSTVCRQILGRRAKPTLPGKAAIGNVLPYSRDELIHRRLASVWQSLEWNHFVHIEVSKVIFAFACIRALSSRTRDQRLDAIRAVAKEHRQELEPLCYLESDDDISSKKADQLIKAFRRCKSIYTPFKNKASADLGQFIELMQNFGDDLRKFGQVAPDARSQPAPCNLFVLPEAIRRLIQAYRTKECNHFVIDAFRNPYEVEYFKRRYSEFYLVGTSRDPLERRATLLRTLSESALDTLDKRERGEAVAHTPQNLANWATTQNVSECLRKADFYVENIADSTRTFPHLRYCLIKLIVLAKYPGSVPPTHDERNMQIAMIARQMSGCISRRVGAVVVDKRGYVEGVGWNDRPAGQVPCALRTGRDLVDGSDATMFSEYERSAKFVNQIRSHQYHDRPFCFREELACIEGKKKKAEFTRALHGEENAFFQALRNSGDELAGGTLYTTASTCTLCAKKAYQLSIERIVYIDEYPGIALDQTIKTGDRKIAVTRFEGITGSAYHWLYEPLVMEKDLIDLYEKSPSPSRPTTAK